MILMNRYRWNSSIDFRNTELSSIVNSYWYVILTRLDIGSFLVTTIVRPGDNVQMVDLTGADPDETE